MKQKIILIFAVLSLTFVPFSVSARGLVPCGGYQEDGITREKPCTVQDIFILVARVTNFLIGFAGIVAVYYIISAGLWLVLSMGSEEAITQKKSQITNAVIGFVLVMMAYMFVNTVVNFMITRNFVTTKNGDKADTRCAFNLKSPLTYMLIDPVGCSSLPDSDLHKTK